MNNKLKIKFDNELKIKFDNGDFKLNESSRSPYRSICDKAAKDFEIALKSYLTNKGYADEVSTLEKFCESNPGLKYDASDEILDETDKFLSFFNCHGLFLK